MRRLLLLLMVLLFGVSHAAAAPSLICQHASAEAHVVALESSDAQFSSEAHQEEAASAAAKKLASMSDKVSAFASGVLPEVANLTGKFQLDLMSWVTAEPYRLSGRVLSPLLQPPAA